MDTIEKKTSLKKRFLAFFASVAVLAGGVVAGVQADSTTTGTAKIEVFDENDAYLAGAHLQVMDAKGAVVVEFDSTGGPQELTLPVGNYKLHQASAPEGYIGINEDLAFEVKPSRTEETTVLKPASALPTSVSAYNDGLPTSGAYHTNDGMLVFCVDASDEFPPRGNYTAQNFNGFNGLSRDQLLRILYVGFVGNAKGYGEQFRKANDYDAGTQFWMATQYAITSYTNPSLAEEYFGKYLGSNRGLANQIKAAANDTSIVVPEGSIAYLYQSPGNQPFAAASFPVVQQSVHEELGTQIKITNIKTTTPPPDTPPSSPDGKVVIKKTDDQGNVLQGAKFQIKDQAGNVLQEFTSTGNDEFTLAPGTYVLQEIKAPEGYQIKGDGKYTFTITAGTVAGTNASVIGTPTKNDFVYGTGAIVVNGSSLAFCVNPQAVFPFEDSDLNVSRPYSVLSENQVDLNEFGSKTKTSKNGGWVNRGNVPANVGLTAAKMEQVKKVLWATYGYASGDTSKDPSGIISSVFGSADYPTAGVYWATEVAIAEISSPGSVNWGAISDGKNYGNVKSLAQALIAAAQGQAGYFATYSGFSIVYLQSDDPAKQNLITPGSEAVELTVVNERDDTPTGEITIDKVDEAGNLLKGAHLQIINEQGKVVEDFVSDGTHMKFRLPVGKYKLHEVSAPAGYTVSPADVEFEVVDDSKQTFTEEQVTAPATLPGPVATTDGAGRFYDEQGHSVLAYCFNASIYLGNDKHADSYAVYDYTPENVAAFRDYSNKFNLSPRRESGAEAAQGYLRILYAGAEGNAYESDIDWVDKWRATQYAITYYGGADKWSPKWEADNEAWGGKSWSQWVRDSKYPDKLEAYKNSLLNAFYDSSLDAKMNEVGYNVAVYAGTEGYWQPNVGVTFGSKTQTVKEWQNENGTVTLFNYPTPSLHTIASNAEIVNENFSIANAGDPAQGPVTVKIRDIVEYNNVWRGQEHIIRGQLVLKSTGEVLDTAYTSFTTPAVKGVAGVNFEFTADAELQEKLRNGDAVVAFETMYQPGLSLYKEDQEGNRIVMTVEEIEASENPDALFVDAQEEASHKDINDAGQTVTFPNIGTTATEGGDHVAPAAENVTIKDVVKYSGLIPGKKYTVSGKLMDKATNKPLKVNGKEVTASKEFTADTANGEVTLEFTLNTTALVGKKLVAFEEVKYEGVTVAVHADINDEEQTVEIEKKPEIGTTATDGTTEDHIGLAAEKTVLKDVVKYENLEPGKKYTVKGKLVKRADGKDIPGATAEATFWASRTGKGTVELTFTYDARKLAGFASVAFEELYDVNGKLIAEHKDIKDEGQTVYYPEVKTNATDNGVKGDKVLAPEKTVTVVDTVTYTNLLPNKEYTVSGVLMDKATNKPLVVNGKQVTASKTFTAPAKKGSVELTFTFDASALEGKTLVVFETVLYKGKEVAVHADIDDVDQTVEISKKPKIGTTATNGNGGKEIEFAKNQKIVDTVSYYNLDTEKTYRVSGVLMDKETGKPALMNGKQVTAVSEDFKPAKANGTVKVTFVVDGRQFGAKNLVVFEKLYEVQGDALDEVTNHENIKDKGQTVYVKEKPEIEKYVNKNVHKDIDLDEVFTYDVIAYITKDADKAVITDTLVDDLQFVSAASDVTVVDLGAVVDHKPNGSVAQDGTPVAAAKAAIDGQTLTVTIDPAEAEHGHWVKVTFDAKIKDGLTIEDLKYATVEKNDPVLTDEVHNGVPNDASYKIYVGNKGKYEDESNTVTVKPVEIRTTAVEKNSGEHAVVLVKGSPETYTIVDTVAWKGLAEGKYVASGTLMNGDTGKEFIVNGAPLTASAEFEVTKAQAAEGKGSVDVEFEVNVTDLFATGTVDTTTVKTVVFEKVFAVKGGVVEETPVATHEDIKDKGQTVTFERKPYEEEKKPSIGTTATDKADGDKALEAGSDVVVKDVVKYENLMENGIYTLKGKLVVKGTDGQTVVCEAEASFIASETGSGTVDVFFEFNTAGLDGKELVVYEYLYDFDAVGKDVSDITPVAKHADDSDAGQTVVVKKTTTPTPTPTPSKSKAPKVTVRPTVKLPVTGLPKTGSSVAVGALSALMLIGVGMVLVRRRDS